MCNRRLHAQDNGKEERETNRKQMESAERDKYLHPVFGRSDYWESEKLMEEKQDGQEQGKEWREQKPQWLAVSLTGGEWTREEERRWEVGGKLLPSRQQGRKKWEEVGFNQTLSRSVCSEWASPPGCSSTERMHAAGGLSRPHAGWGLTTQNTDSGTEVSALESIFGVVDSNVN